MPETTGLEPGREGSAGSAWDELIPPAVDEEAEAEANPYSDAAVEAAEAEAEDVPGWLGTKWRDLPQESMPQVWRWLRGWVDWLVEAHSVGADEVPPCWFRHQDIVEELWAAANAEYQAWEATTPTMTPMTAWHFHLRMMRDRLNGKAKECVGQGSHVPVRSFRPGVGPAVLAVDEADWAAHLAEITDAQPAGIEAGQRPRLWRMCAVDDLGELVVSDATDVSAEQPQGPVTITVPVRRGMDSEGAVLLGATVSTGAREVERTWWESSTDGGASWDKAVTSEVVRAPEQDEAEESEQGEDEQA